MKNITLAIDDEILDRVRIVAAHQRTTVNAMVRNYLAEVAGRDEKQAEARKQLLQLMETSKGRMATGWKFDREETHER
jgi:predicted transcriptional regulator